MKLYDELKERGLIDNITSPDLIEKLNNGGLTFYVGVDPTGDTLHIGHYCTVISTTKRLMDAGHNPIIIAGGGTGLIGDPKPSSERPMITKEAVAYNIENIKKQVDKLLNGNITIVNNADWLLEMNAIDYLRDFGKFFNINYMLNKDTVKRRLDVGITYTEFSYMLLQSIDFLKLYEKYNCTLQTGGQDQWGNITSGLELIRKVHGDKVECYGLTVPLITKADGTKFGKTETGEALWLDKDKTSPYEMYQYLVNTEDSVVVDYLKKITFVSLDEIKELEKSLKEEPEKRLCGKTLAYSVVEFVHGTSQAEEAKRLSEEIFNKKQMDNVKSITLELDLIKNNISLVDLLVMVNLFASKSEARRMVEQSGISINEEKEADVNRILNENDLKEGKILIQKGKKTFINVVFE